MEPFLAINEVSMKNKQLKFNYLSACLLAGVLVLHISPALLADRCGYIMQECLHVNVSCAEGYEVNLSDDQPFESIRCFVVENCELAIAKVLCDEEPACNLAQTKNPNYLKESCGDSSNPTPDENCDSGFVLASGQCEPEDADALEENCEPGFVLAYGKCEPEDSEALTVDSDGDGIVDYTDECPMDPNPAHKSGSCENSDDPNGDTDGDKILNSQDNCPDDFNPTQLDADVDGMGSKCDTDGDNFNANTTLIGGDGKNCSLNREARGSATALLIFLVFGMSVWALTRRKFLPTH